MRKILIILLTLFTLCGCSNSHIFDDATKFVEKGYSQDAATIIQNYSKENKKYLLDNYSKEIEKLILNNNSEEEVMNFFLSNFDVDTYIYILKNKLNDKQIEKVKKFINDPFYMYKNIYAYIKYENNFSDTRSLVEYVNSKAYQKGYEEYESSDLTKGELMIASKIYYLGDYVPNNLVDVDDGYYILAKPQLVEMAKKAYIKMADDARNEGLDFYISTAYRSYDFQNTLYNKYLETDPKEVVDTYSSRPGFSDHQIGLSCDIRTKEKAFNEFTLTPEAKWLADNAYIYGFIQRYPDGKENITGYISESWHYRYVGIDAAKIIKTNNITFDEYYAYYVEK